MLKGEKCRNERKTTPALRCGTQRSRSEILRSPTWIAKGSNDLLFIAATLHRSTLWRLI
jgi:hypothetical protein